MSAIAEHVISDATDGGALRCLHCGARMKLELPTRLNDFLDAGRSFLARHLWCRAPAPAEASRGEGPK